MVARGKLAERRPGYWAKYLGVPAGPLGSLAMRSNSALMQAFPLMQAFAAALPRGAIIYRTNLGRRSGELAPGYATHAPPGQRLENH